MATSRSGSEARGGYATGRATKQSIVEHAAKVFTEKGFYGASLRGIAREAGLDHTLLVHHFKNKTLLLLAVIEWYDEQHEVGEYPQLFDTCTSISEFERADEMFIAALIAAAETNAKRPGLVRLFSVLSAEAGEPEHPARAALQQRHEVILNAFADFLEQRDAALAAVGAGASPMLSARDRAVLFVSTWEGLQVYDALHPGDIDLPKKLGEAARRIV